MPMPKSPSFEPGRPVSLARMAIIVKVQQKWLKEQADAGIIPCLRAGSRLLFDPVLVMRRLVEMADKPQPVEESPK